MKGPRKNNVIKGPVFPSFQYAGSSDKKRMVFLPHTRHRAAIRNLKSQCIHAERLKDEASVTARRRLRDSVANEPFVEYAYWHLLHAAWEAHEGTGVALAEALNYLLDKFGAEKADAQMSASTQAIPQEAAV